MKLIAALLVLALVAVFAKTVLFSFRSQTPDDYATTTPVFALKKHLSGRFASEGLIFGPNGKMTNSFTAQMHAQWNGDTGTLSEVFTYSNGRQQSRKWHLKLGQANRFTATADDIVGTAQGTISGATVSIRYKIILPKEAGGHTLHATDWLYLTENGVIMNKSEMRKFGVKLAELVATMRPVSAPHTTSQTQSDKQ